ncbi:peptide-methionine (S)-S-oxide reductase MsrA [Candidatus Bathyarchaeota archaeon]|nr:peptide-methionine (S)-S-oxide reductase MsrA [Candidatus Bathyarchaeota archaeon]
MNTRKAIFAAGCFWGVEETFRHLEGVVNTTVGYTGGTTPNPTYKQVCTGKTGHAEAVLVEYNPDMISYEQLLQAFWKCHDPTQVNRQGPDVGTQYRSAIFYHDEQQRKLAEASKKNLENSGRFTRPVATRIVPVEPFYKAEEYHQQYLEKNGRSHCVTFLGF